MTTRQVLATLETHESRNITFVEADGSWPMVWSKARGVHVWNPEGRRYLDLTAAFGVAAAGHANPAVVRAGRAQLGRLAHAMGDVHPHEWKARLARELSLLTFERWSTLRPKNPLGPRRGKVLFCNSGFEAVEAALKTAILATDRAGILAFEGAYHGVGYGALQATHRSHFRGPFQRQLKSIGHFAPFPELSNPRSVDRCRAAVEKRLRQGTVGAVLMEPIQARGGIRVPPPDFLAWLRQLCDATGTLLVLDEIYTGFGRTGSWFACEQYGVEPDLICLGKALTGGFPLSACVGRGDLMDAAWPPSQGEAIHTSTFLGHPVGCAMALAQLEELERLKLCQRAESTGHWLREQLPSLIPTSSPLVARTLGMGLMLGIELTHADGTPATATTIEWMKRALKRGLIVLPEGEHSNVLSFTPPLTITRAQLKSALKILAEEFIKIPAS